MFKSILTLHGRRTAAAVLLALGALVLAFGPLAGEALSAPRCRPVGGRLLDEHVEGSVSVGRMTGSLRGDYTYSFIESHPADATLTQLLFLTGTSVVETRRGTLSFFESATQDTAEFGGVNATVLMTVTDGTGAWAGASGHIVLTGFFNSETLTGNWTYRGEICTP
jgi:hypothetical protein